MSKQMDIGNAVYFEPVLSLGELAALLLLIIAIGIFFAWVEQKMNEEHRRW